MIHTAAVVGIRNTLSCPLNWKKASEINVGGHYDPGINP